MTILVMQERLIHMSKNSEASWELPANISKQSGEWDISLRYNGKKRGLYEFQGKIFYKIKIDIDSSLHHNRNMFYIHLNEPVFYGEILSVYKTEKPVKRI